MYYISKKIEVAGAHSLKLSYESKCQNLHGHNWNIEVFCAAQNLNKDGMVCDFKHIKEKIHSYLDHGNFNELLPFNPTAENIAKWIVETVPQCYKAVVQESNGNTAVFELHIPNIPVCFERLKTDKNVWIRMDRVPTVGEVIYSEYSNEVSFYNSGCLFDLLSEEEIEYIGSPCFEVTDIHTNGTGIVVTVKNEEED